MPASSPFSLTSPLRPAGDQPVAIGQLTQGLIKKAPYQTLLGVTGSGKTMTMAHVIAKANKPALIMSHNKTLAAQLYGEIKGLFPNNAVEYFISYYDYYQPEAYMPTTDTYIAKDASINEDIDRLRLRSTASLMERSDVIIIATVSAIYGLGDPASYRQQMLFAEPGQSLSREDVMKRLVEMQYKRNDLAFERSTFRVRGDVLDVLPAYEEFAIRFEFYDNVLERVTKVDPLTGRTVASLPRAAIYPAKHFVVAQPTVDRACKTILIEMEDQVKKFTAEGKLLEAQRIKERTNHDVEMLRSTGTCQGIENYSRHLTGRAAGERPSCLLDYFPKDFLVFLDESHVTLPQIGGMYAGDRSRKETLVNYGFRLPSAMDNRPLTATEFKAMVPQMTFVSATPGDTEIALSGTHVVEQIIRPTGLVDPQVEVRPVSSQVDNLLEEIRIRVKKSERVLVTTLTKRSAEDLSDYLEQAGVRVRYLHSDIVTLERVEIIRGLRLGEFDVLVGINLLREGLDLPEVSLVAILDADQEGFLRSDRSLIQTIGRAARHSEGRAILYADKMTDSMKRAISETDRRRKRQQKHNTKHGITPKTVSKSIDQIKLLTRVADVKRSESVAGKPVRDKISDINISAEDKANILAQIKSAMEEAALKLDFETAALLRDQLFEIETGKAAVKPVRGRYSRRPK